MGGRSRVPAWVVATGLYLAHSLWLGEWIVDDAGISFAYARNLAAGHGLVAQPGVAPVEGFSNPLWVLLHAAADRLGLFHHVWTPKALALVCAALTFRQLQAVAAGPLAGGIAAVFLAANPSFAIWCNSGLENPLYALLAVTLLRVCLRDPPGSGAVVAAAALLFALAATRLDGLAFAAAPAAVWGLDAWRRRRRDRAATGAMRPIACLGLAAVLIGLGFLCRRGYYGAWLPNTYVAKGAGVADLALRALCSLGLVAAILLAARRLRARGRLPAGPLRVLLAVLAGALLFDRLDLHPALRALARDGGVLCAGVVFAHGIFGAADRRTGALLVFAGLGVFVHRALPGDWMGEGRFATALLPFWVLLLVEAIAACIAGATARSRPQRIAVAGAVALAVLAQGVHRTLRFRADPTVPLQVVATDTWRPLERVAAALAHREPHSVLLADVGALLLFGDLRVFDAGLLCDREMALALRDGDTIRFYDYLFATTRPSLLLTHPDQDRYLALDGDPRFRRDYAPIFEDLGRKQATGDPQVATGLFVRRELVPPDTNLEELRRRFEGR